MNVVVECDVVLSKKLEAICEEGEPISIQISSISGNKGRGLVRLVCKTGTSEKDVVGIGETSVMLKINMVSDDVKSLGATPRFTNLLGRNVPEPELAVVAKTSPHIPEGEPWKPAIQPVQAVADTSANTEQTIKAVFAALAAAGLSIPANLSQQIGQTGQSNSNQTNFKDRNPVAPPQDNSIMTYDELMEEVAALPNIEFSTTVPTGRKLTPREAESLLAQMPKLRRKAYLRNNLQSQFMISDLSTTIDGTGGSLVMQPGAAFDLTKIPAKNILNSSELKWCFDTQKVSLVTHAAYIASFQKVAESANAWDKGGLKVYGSRDDVQMDEGAPEVMVNEDEKAPTSMYEESSEMQSIIGSLPLARKPR